MSKNFKGSINIFLPILVLEKHIKGKKVLF